MNIIIDCDKNFLKPLATMIRSLSLSSKNNINTFYFISFEDKCLDSANIAFLKKQLNKNDIFTIIKVPHFLNKEITGSYSEQVLLKIIGLYYLPNKVNKIIHIDGDIIIKGNIDAFYNTEMGNNVILGTEERFDDQNLKNNSLQIKDNVYLNAGMILINVKAFKDNFPTLNHLVQTISSINFKMPRGEQDILNYIFQYKKIAWGDDTYMHFSLPYLNNKNYLSKRPLVIHYAGAYKPWKEEGIYKYYFTFWKYAKKVYPFNERAKLKFKRFKWLSKYCLRKIFK